MGFVFISYSSKNYDSANSLKTLLNQNDINTWMAPNDIPTGVKYAEIITYAIQDCSCFILLLTPEAQNSNWVPREVERAVNFGKKILPLQLKNVDLNGEFQLYISVNHLLPVNKIDAASTEMQKLIASIKSDAELPGFVPEKTYQAGDLIDGKYEVMEKIKESDGCDLLVTRNIRTDEKWTVRAIYKTLDNFLKFGKIFLSEFNILNKQINHPAFPPVVDIIDHKDHMLVVMKYLEGETLSTILQNQGAQSEPSILNWAIQIAEAINLLHNQVHPVVHLNLQPDQFVLMPEGTISMRSLIQFQNMKTSSAKHMTLRSSIFVAPEEHDSGKIDQRTDIYSFGVLLYSLITGRDFSKPPYVVLPIRANNPDLSKALEYIVMKCMKPNPQDRYQSMNQLLADLTHIDKLNFKLRHPFLFRKIRL